MQGKSDEKSATEEKIRMKKPKPKKHEKIYTPITLYWIKDVLREFVNHKYFPDSILSVFAIISVAIAAPFYPLVILMPLLAITFILARMHPLAGLMALLFVTFPMLIYQMPLLAWLYVIFLTIALVLGYRHYRTITLIYALISLPFSFLGYILEVPVFVLGILYIGFKRGSIAAAAAILLVPIISGLTGIQNTAPIAYSPLPFRSSIGNDTAFQALSPSYPNAPSLGSFPYAFSNAIVRLFSRNVAGSIFHAFGLSALALAYGIEPIVIQMIVWLLVVFTVSNYVIKSRSGFKGAESSVYSGLILIAYFSLSPIAKIQASSYAIVGFVITPPLLFLLEFNDVEIVRSLAIMKQDFLGKFGEAFEELTSGTNETLDDVGDYEETKKELREALLAPIEHRGIAGAYNIKAAKGILLFGPPGTGKTLMMRALSNEIRARFFYVKTSSILSPYPGESAKTLSKIFDTAKKDHPSVLFFDEIDGIAGKREAQEGEVNKQLFTTLLSEMDGFQKIEGVCIVGSTNVPNLLDPSIFRPGRFDKIIYMPLPDRNGRIEIFKKYAGRYPMASDIDYEKLADLTNRFSGADIANVYSEAARHVADVAMQNATVLKIETVDLVNVIDSTKPSVSLGNLADYERFKMDYERRMYHESTDEKSEGISMNDVVGLTEAKKALREAIELPFLHPDLIEKYDVANVTGILLFGPPGCGKSMLMRAVANDVGSFRMLTISGSEISREGLEKAVETIKEIFNRAKENAPSIIFMDEIDALVPDRNKASELGVHIATEVLQELDNVKNAEVVVVGATNRPDAVDNALLQPGRMDRIIFASPPDMESRKELFEKSLKRTPLNEYIDFDRLAERTQGYTGADIANICKRAKMEALEIALASAKEKKISTEDIEALIKNIRPSAPNVILGRYSLFLSTHGIR